MGRNVKGSRSWSVPRAERKRRPVELTLEPDTLDWLENAADAEGTSKSRVVDRLVAEKRAHAPTDLKNRTRKS